MAHVTTRVDQRATLRSLGTATQWRLLLLWVGLLLIPTIVASLPLWRTLASLLDHSVHAQAWANHFDGVAFGDTLFALPEATPALGAAVLVSVLLALLLSPFLNGMAVGSALSGRRLGFGHLLQCGVVEYPRMFRLLLWALPLYALAAAVAATAGVLADKFAARAVLESSADSVGDWATVAMVVAFVVVQVVMDASRAAFMADPALRSSTRAFGRGWRLLLRRPLSTLGWFLGVSVIGYGVAMVLGVVRIAVDGGSVGAWLAGIVLVQVVALALAWAHVARLYALCNVALALPPRQAATPPTLPEAA